MLISEDYRQEVFEHFPQLPNKEIYYELTKQVTQAFVEKTNLIQDPKPIKDFNNISCGWKITDSVSKKLDSFKASWKLPVEMPVDAFLDYPVFSSQGFTKDHIHWQEQTKHFATTWVPSYPTASEPKYAHEKIKIDSDKIVTRLQQLVDMTSLDKQTSVCLTSPQLQPLSPIPVPDAQPADVYALSSFVPTEHLENFKLVSKPKPKEKGSCELDFMRFKF